MLESTTKWLNNSETLIKSKGNLIRFQRNIAYLINAVLSQLSAHISLLNANLIIPLFKNYVGIHCLFAPVGVNISKRYQPQAWSRRGDRSLEVSP